MLLNLLGNAVEYTPRGGRITIRSAARDGRFDIVIANTNDSLDSADLPYLTEPFWRKDAAHADPSHSGLGLALVRQLAVTSQIDFQLSLNGSGELEARLSIPERT